MKSNFTFSLPSCLVLVLWFFMQTNSMMAQVGNYLHFDGTNDRVQITPPAITGNPTTFTLETWVKWEGTSIKFDRIVSFAGPNVTRIELGIGLDYTNPTVSLFMYEDNTGSQYVHPDINNNPVLFNDGLWHHVALVRNGDDFTLYVDGLTQVSATRMFSFSISSQRYGQWGGGSTAENWPGPMDEGRVWNIARTQAQIQADMSNYFLSTSTPGLVANYKFDHGSAGGNNAGVTTLINSVAPGSNSGTLTNFALIGSTSNWLGSIFPVELLDFNARYNNYTNEVALDWATASELNSDHFELQHSTDAQNWRTLADYTARGQSTTISEYRHLHGNPANGKNYYRLKMVDNDGSFEYSKIVYATAADRDELFVAHPNPVQDLLYLELGVQPEEPASVMIIDGLNRVVQTLELTDQQNQINLAHLDAGIYTLVCNTGEWYVRQQIIKL
jgi:Concanavalin A-like lectin/glucanases superfamily/Secretion system C-terminal sorting domain